MKQLIKNFLQNIEWIITGLFLIILPIIFSKKLLDPVLYSRYLTLSIWLSIVTILIAIKIYRGKFSFYFSRTDKFIFGAAALFIIVNIISSFSAINNAEAIFKTFKEFAFLTSFFYFYQIIKNNDKGRGVLIKSVIIMSLIFLTIGVVQLFDADFTKFKAATGSYAYWFRQAITHVMSTLASINPFASLLFLSLAFSTYGTICYKKVWRIISVTALAGSLFFIFILASKASWGALTLAFIIAVILIYVYLFKKMPKEQGKFLPAWGKASVLLIPIFVMLTGIVVVQKSETKVVKIVVDKVQQVLSPELCLSNIYNSDNPSSAQTRTLVWANTIQMARENPILGVGPGQWRIEYAKYGIDGFEYEIRNGIKHFQRTHNDFLWILGEVGFLGLFLYLFIYISILVVSFKNFYKSSDTKTMVFNGLAFSVLIGFMLIMFVSFPRERISHNMVYLLLFAIILSFNKSTATNKNTKTIKIASAISLIIIMALSAFNIKLASDMVKGDKTSRALRYGTIKKNYPLLLRAARSLEGSYYTLDPFSTPIPYYKASGLHSIGKIEEAKIEFEKAYKLHPYHVQVLNNLATSYDLTGNKQKALEYYKKALKISPRYNDALINISIVYYNLNNLDKSLECISKVNNSKNKSPKYEKTFITICRKRAVLIANKTNEEKLKIWFYDKNKIKATFVKFKKGNESFDKILLKEIGK